MYNGAAVYCPVARDVIERRVLGQRELTRVIDYATRTGCLAVSMCVGRKLGWSPPGTDVEAALHDMTHVELRTDPSDLRQDDVIRISLFSKVHSDPESLADDFQRQVQGDFYVTHFPLRLLPAHRGSDLVVLDVHPRCPGKARAIELLGERYGIPASEVVAVGDATNDLPMIEAAGLGVAMEVAMPEVHAAADLHGLAAAA